MHFVNILCKKMINFVAFYIIRQGFLNRVTCVKIKKIPCKVFELWACKRFPKMYRK